MINGMKFHRGQRYLMINGYIYPWTKILAKKKDAREYFPDFDVAESAQVVEESEHEIKESSGFEDEMDEKFDELRTHDAMMAEPMDSPYVTDNTGIVTEDFLMSRTKQELDDYAKNVYGVDIDKREKKESLVAQVLELQRLSGDEE